MTKSTGDRYERRLVRFFDEAGYAVMRSPSSGSATDRDQPDVYITDGRERVAFEQKYVGDADGVIYVEEEEVESLRRFARRANASARISARFAQTKTFFVFNPSELPTTEEGNYRISKAIVDESETKLADEDDADGWDEVYYDDEDDRFTPREFPRKDVIAV